MHGAHPHPSALSSRPLQLKTSSRSSVTTKNGLGASHRVDPKSTRNDYDSVIRCTGRLQQTHEEAKNASMERTHTPVCFQVGISS